jgi:hypothetical protein
VNTLKSISFNGFWPNLAQYPKLLKCSKKLVNVCA